MHKMSVYFQITRLVLKGAEVSQRVNYGGRMNTLHLECNSAFRLPFAIKIPKGVYLAEIEGDDFIAKMEAPDGVNFTVYQLIIRRMRLPTAAELAEKGPLPKYAVVIERVWEDLLPLAEEVKYDDDILEWPSAEKKAAWVGYQEPQSSGLPTQDDPVIVASHTADGTGWYTYKIYTEEEERA